MEDQNLVVIRFGDGRVLKGITRDFSPGRPMLHISTEPAREIVEVRTRQLKAIFFVKSFEGFPGREDVRGFIEAPAERAQGKKIAVRFRDGEFLCGYTMSWSPERDGFFVFPADVGCNNERVYVLTAATAEVKAGPQAEALAQRVLGAPPSGRADTMPGPRAPQGGRPAASDAA